MTESLIQKVFSILGTLLVSLILFSMIFTAVGQNFLWRAIEPAMENQWKDSTLNNGAARTYVYEKEYDKYKDNQFDYGSLFR